MALQRPIILGVLSSSFLRVAPGGVTPITTVETKSDAATVMRYCVKRAFVINGQIYFHGGTWYNTAYGLYTYNYDLGQMESPYNMLGSDSSRLIPMGQYLFYSESALRQFRLSEDLRSHSYLGLGGGSTLRDYVIHGNTIHITSNANMYTLTYPFTAPSLLLGADDITRLCVYRGVAYGIDVNAGVCFLKSFVGGVWGTIGVGFTPPESADIQATYANRTAFFEWGGKLWLIISYNNGAATQWARCFELNVATGGATERNDLIPAAWKVAPTHTNCTIFEVIDDVGSSRQVFIVKSGGGFTAAWDMWEFNDAAWVSIASGGEMLYPQCGVVWDYNCTGASVISGADSVPSSYAVIGIRTGSISNITTDIDPRYEDLTTYTAPPRAACTEKAGVGSCGKTGLRTKPTATTLSDLSDGFDDGVINSDLWEQCQPGWDTVAPGRDFGLGNYVTSGANWCNLQETAGRIAFGGTEPATVVAGYWGCGIASRWSMTGAFQVDVTIGGLANLTGNNTLMYYSMFIKVMVSTNIAYCVGIWKNAALASFANGVTWQANNNAPSISAVSVHPPADGDIIRIARTAGGVWSMTLDVGGANENMLPGITPNYTDPCRIVLGACSQANTNWASGIPGPGFSDITVSGAGSLGYFRGYQSHNFMWDHIVDLGAGYVGTTQMYIDTN